MNTDLARLAVPALPADDATTAAIVIPTIGKSNVVPETYRVLRDRLPPKVRVVLVVNPVDVDDAQRTIDAVLAMGAPDGGQLDVVRFDEPVGFGGALNAGFAYLANTGGVPKVCIAYNDDLRATPFWLESLLGCFDENGEVMLCTEHPRDGIRPTYPVSQYGRVGLAGPVTTVAAGMQGACDPDEVRRAGGHDGFARHWREATQDVALSTSFLSGFCVAILRDCMADLLVECPIAGYGPFDSGKYPVAGYEDNDLCVRARRAGWRGLIDWGCYVGHIGHQSFDAAFPEMQRGMRNRARYYEAHASETQRPQTLAALYRVRIGSVHDLHLLRASLERHASIADGFALLLTNNPLRDMADYPDWPSHRQLKPQDQTFLRAMRATLNVNELPEGFELPDGMEPQRDAWKFTDDTEKVRTMFYHWVLGVLLSAPGTRFSVPEDGDIADVPVKVELWTGAFNERDERNAAIEMAESLGTDWLWSIDGDEVIEDRVRREHFDRWMTHPDPLVGQWDFGWVDHWNDAQHYRTDPPWGDGGQFNGGRHGRRLWRAGGGRILSGTANGLHGGNLPDAGPLSMRITGGRFRHFGYVRQLDRMQRFQAYNRLDPNPDPLLVGGKTYRHIVSAEGMRIEWYNAHNGIGLHVLAYEGTDPDQLAAILDKVYGLVDHIVLVWTSASPPEESMPAQIELYARLFKCDVMHCDLRQDGEVHFAATRNAAIEHLSTVNEQAQLGLGWGLFLDPDEQMPHAMIDPAVSIRRMAESSESWGWMFEYDNPIRTGVITPSESVRLFRLKPQVRLRGRVHESFDAAWRALVAQGHAPNIRRAPFRMFNPGLMDGDTCTRKLRMYAKGLIAELQDNPDNSGAWYSLGLQFEAENRVDEAVVCYQKAVAADPDGFVGYRALMIHHAKTALALAMAMQANLTPVHPYHRIGAAAVDFLRRLTETPDNPATEQVLTDLAPPDVMPSTLREDAIVTATQDGVRDALAAVEQAGGPDVDEWPVTGQDDAAPDCEGGEE